MQKPIPKSSKLQIPFLVTDIINSYQFPNTAKVKPT